MKKTANSGRPTSVCKNSSRTLQLLIASHFDYLLKVSLYCSNQALLYFSVLVSKYKCKSYATKIPPKHFFDYIAYIGMLYLDLLNRSCFLFQDARRQKVI